MKGWIVCRKKWICEDSRSIKRHWAQWKHRYCAVQDGNLFLSTSETHTVTEEFSLR
jgi:hypothetical protein